MINKPTLPPKRGYVEVEVDGVRLYKNAETGVLERDEKKQESEFEQQFTAAIEKGLTV